MFFNAGLNHLYVAVGDPDVIDVFDTTRLRRLGTAATEPGCAHLSFDATRGIVCAFPPGTHRAAVYQESDR